MRSDEQDTPHVHEEENQENLNIPEFIEHLEKGDDAFVKAFFAEKHVADSAELLSHLNEDRLKRVLAILGEEFDPEILVYMEENAQNRVTDLLDNDSIATLLPELDSDDAVDVIENLDEEDQKEVLEAIPAHERAILEQSLNYAEKSAGRLMQREMVTVPPNWTVGQVIDIFNLNVDLPDNFYLVFVVDLEHKPVGILPLSRILKSKRSITVSDIMDKQFRTIHVDDHQEEVAHMFRKYALVSAPVVNDDDILLGVIMVDDVVDVIEEEAEEDIYYLSGLTSGDLSSAVLRTVRMRLPWLIINLGAAFLASYVISFFQDTLDKKIELAVLMALAPSLATNAGTQTLTVIIRALAMRKLDHGIRRILNKEAMVGIINGFLIALLTGAVAGFWFNDFGMCIVVSLAMVITIALSTMAGVLIPVTLQKTSIDPAVASSVFLTTVTDVLGFLIFLGLAVFILF